VDIDNFIDWFRAFFIYKVFKMNNVKLHLGLQRMLLIGYFLIFSLGVILFFIKIDLLISLPKFVFWALLIVILTTILAWTYVFILKENIIEILHKKNENLNYALDIENSNWLNTKLLQQINKTKISLDFTENFIWAFFGVLLIVFSFFIPNKTSKANTLSIFNANNSIKGISKENFTSGLIKVKISPPAYTNISPSTSEDLQIMAPIHSNLSWEIKGSSYSLNLQWFIGDEKGAKRKFVKKNQSFHYSDVLNANGIYVLQAYLSDSLVFQSPYYTLEAIADLAPEITPKEKNLVQIFDPKKSFLLPISAFVKDDYAVRKVQVIATLARGNGENVKFREKTFTINNESFKSSNLTYTLDLKGLNFEPGDELFYYFLAVDNKWPEPNFGKSDTYFLKFKDPKEPETLEQNTMAMNILPEYFRSQRQIIIDTEKLIKKRNKIKSSVFEEESNTIGFDQKSLRIRYGQYLGEEFETNLGHAAESDNPLAGFTHDHDSKDHQDEGHSEAPSHEHEDQKPSESEDPLAALMEQYVHSHDDAEMNTFYEQSTRSLLKMSLEQMWQAELHLRLYEPEKALSFENKALTYLKEAQQKARNYTQKSGFDPSPIKEKEKRLTGKLEKINTDLSFTKLLNEEKIANLSTIILGLLQKPTLSIFEKQQIAQLLKIVPSEVKIGNELQKLLNGNTLSEPDKNKISNALLKLIGYQKSNNALHALDVKNINLRAEFFKQLAQ
jgi:hypothetical protein